MKLIVNPGQKVFFTSDSHLGHKNICRGVSSWDEDNTRPFDTVEEMNDRILEGINSLAGPEDVIFHLGDFSFDGFDKIEPFRRRINCRNIHLVLGNHDHHIRKNRENTRSLFASVNDYVNLQVNFQGRHETEKHFFVLCHYPIASWDGLRKGVMHLHGHVHFSPELAVGPGKMLDVGMDGNGLEMWPLENVLETLRDRPNISMFSKDHHSSI